VIDTITQYITSLSGLLDSLSIFIPKLIASCAVITAFLPPPDQHSVLSKVHKSINLIAFNFGKAANKDV
jgi:hypothetical protein